VTTGAKGAKRRGAKDVLVQTRIDGVLHSWIKERARAEGVSVAQWARTTFIEKRAESLPPAPEAPITRIMNAVEAIAAYVKEKGKP
jgi:hypothetical protein